MKQIVKKVYIRLPKNNGSRYPNGGNEKEWMTQIAHKLASCLKDKEITCEIAGEGKPLQTLIRESNEGEYDLHLALRSQAAPAEQGCRKGAQILYYSRGKNGSPYAKALAKQYRSIYPQPELVTVKAAAALDELRKTKATALLLETAYHDNPQDEIWLTSHTTEIAEAIAKGIANAFQQENEYA